MAKSVADVATSSVSLTGDQAAGEISLLKNIDNKQQLFDATKAFTLDRENAAHLNTLQDLNATPEQKQVAYTTFVNHVAEHLGVPPTEARVMVDTHYRGSYDRRSGTIYINDRAQAGASDAINTLGHEVSHHVDNLQDGEAAATRTRQYEDNREEYADNIGDTTEELVNFQFSNNNVGKLATHNTNRNTATSATVARNTKAHHSLPAETTDHALCGGICVGAVIGTALYVLDNGEGDPVEGIEKIGAGDHPVGDVIDIVTEAAIKISYAHFPAETAQVLTQATRLGEAVNAVVEYVDDSTGNVVSEQWHRLDKATQHRLIGAGKIVSVVVPAAKLSAVTKGGAPGGRDLHRRPAEIVKTPNGVDGGKAVLPNKYYFDLKLSESKTLLPSKVNQELTQNGYRAPYSKNVPVVQAKLAKDTEFVRVFTQGKTKASGKWIMKADDIKGLTPKQIQQKYALPNLPTHISSAKIPAGTNIRAGKVAPNYGSKGGNFQYELLEQVKGGFSNSRPLEKK